MIKLILVRHGQTTTTNKDTVLTIKGQEEAKLVANKLIDFSVNKIYVSNLTRAKETMTFYLDKLTNVKTDDPKIIISPKLAEIYRVIIGGPLKEGTSKNRFDNDKKRADEIFKELIKEKEDVIVFAHGNLIKYFLSKVMNLNPRTFWENTTINNCSITIIESNKDKNKFHVNIINDTAHLK